jgi:hypothetical protein
MIAPSQRLSAKPSPGNASKPESIPKILSPPLSRMTISTFPMALRHHPSLLSPRNPRWVNPYLLTALLLTVSCLIAQSSTPSATVSISPENRDFFENKVRPILSAHCLECHSAAQGKIKGGLSLDTREDLLKGGENGEILHLTAPDTSPLLHAVEWKGDLQMPPKKQLSKEQIAALREWLQRGAPDPRDSSSTPRLTKADHWAFQPVKKPTPPTPKNQGWVKNAIDRFVLAKLEEQGMLPADPPETGTLEEQRRKKEALLRRAYFDMVGLPPNPREISEYVADPSPDAFEKVVDRLLASPAYGERWARHWMDTARYSDTTGSRRLTMGGEDYRYPYAWAYRDWLIRAINADMPYDQFILNQLAADRIPGNARENLAALGFLTVGARFPFQDDVINDRIDVVGRGFLGLTLACARCHDHKFDPIKMADYYALRGVFKSVVEPKEGPLLSENEEPSKESIDWEKKKTALEREVFSRVNAMQRELSANFRKHASLYFQLAYYDRQKDNAEAQRKSTALAEGARLKVSELRMVGFHLAIHVSQQDPVLGPFLKLIQVEGKPDPTTEAVGHSGLGYQKFLGKELASLPPNPAVLDFLSKTGKQASDLKSVAALFEKFCRERVEPLLKEGIFERLASARELSEADQAKAQLACFPLQPVPGQSLTIQ